MQILLGQTFLDPEDNPMPLTLRDVAKQALLATFEDEKNLPLESKVKRYDLYTKVKAAVDPSDFTTDEIVEIKKLIGKAYSILIVGQAVEMLEGKSVEK
jgi:hypothetical protein